MPSPHAGFHAVHATHRASGASGPWTDALRGTPYAAGDHLTVTLPPRSGTVLVSDRAWLAPVS